MTSKTLRAAIYARYSTDKQRAESLVDQYHVCEKHAAREGFKVVAKFGDEKISGGTAERKGYQDMLEAAREHKFDVLIAEDLKRFWREQAEQWRAIKELLDLKIHIVTVSGIDSRQSGFEIIASVIGAAAELDRKESSYRTRRGLDGLARAGKNAGGKAYGYTSIDKVRTVDPDQAKVVKRIFELRAGGWSAQRIARQLNEDRVPSPGSTWDRADTGPRRKTKKGWRPSAIAGDVTRGVGILNNPMYRGQVIWGRSKWTRSAANSNIRSVAQVDPSEWIVHEVPSLRIVSDELWNKVHAIQTATNPRREAVKRGVIKGRNGPLKRIGGRDSRYWLGTLLVCECGANYIGNGTKDFVCPAHISNNCSNDMRFRRDDANAALFDLFQTELLSKEQIALGRARIEQELKQRAKDEERAQRDAADGADVRKLDQELKALQKMALRPAAMAAAVAEIEKERAELLARAAGKQDKRESRARQLLARMPEIVDRYRALIGQAVRVLADERAVHDAREATRRLLVGGHIVLAPNPAHTAVAGPVHLVGLGDHVLELSGWQRQTRGPYPQKLNGSGGRIR